PAYGARFLLAKTEIIDEEIEQEEDNFVAALEWGEVLGAQVASSSLGYIDWYSYCDMDGNTAVTTRAVDIAVSLGVVCVTAAGNQGAESPPENPCDTLTHYIMAPADADSVISVGAVNGSGTIAHFSSRGPTFDDRIKPEVCAKGVATACASPADSVSYTFKSGTSLSTPLVAGAAAVILSAHPDWAPMDVRKALIMTASRADSADNEYGYGVVDVWAAINFDPSAVELPSTLPSGFWLSQNYPNPFNVSTGIAYDIPRSGRVSLAIFDLLGKQVETLVNGETPAGRYSVQWDGSRFSSGIYFAHLNAGDFSETRKLILLK
ncbi:MAG: S8/S53 family peptidase, partial [Candidatus Neomarinimicrobiota bacterium]